MKKMIKNKIFLVLIFGLIFTIFSVYGANTYHATDIVYKTADGDVALNEILDDLYAGNCKRYTSTSNLKYNTDVVAYSSSSISEALSELYESVCSFSSNVKVGGYISMKPTSTSFTTNTSMTGYSSSQTINPSELNLWRVIKINEDGTIEVVSEYTSSVIISFMKQAGLQNIVGYLNVIASQYGNSKYTIGSRHMGYSTQIEYIIDASKLNTSSSPWSCDTGGSCSPSESQGGGDILYITDTNLVQTALGTLKANKAGTTTSQVYFLSSRYYHRDNSERWFFGSRYVKATGDIVSNGCHLWDYHKSSYSLVCGAAIRPILTLKSGLSAKGSGTSSDPYVLP